MDSVTWYKDFHPHWWKYHDIIVNAPMAFYYFLGTFFAVVGFLGVFGNIIVVWVFSSTPSLRTPSNVLVINLAICDILFSALIGFPMSALSCFQRHWIWGNFGCQFYSFVAGITGLASINCLAVIAVDRYLVVGQPLAMLNQSHFRRSFYHVLIIWTWACVWSAMPLIGWGEYILEGFGVSCTFDYLTRTTWNISFNVCLFTFCFGMPVSVIILSYIGIIRSIAKNRKEFSSLTAENSSRARQEIKIAKVFAVCMTAFILCWVPYATVAQLGIYGYDQMVSPYTAELPVMLAKTSALWNPIIYAFSHPKYRKCLKELPIFRQKRKFRFLGSKSHTKSSDGVGTIALTSTINRTATRH
ncbi:hypothetical protein HELRODRAFT_85596 [Helobdella robusta]|uniref:G-protein coupled receptors family 1 profile domain-containing protein n=1 Tax=Helobdella robusta TaxID=6412 RepID=T1G602_HELRO|nr:hypothetical protein HELRODRAFT_85596 [Helobdella robusta]ESN97272.1 hypothetical protein HELRODRAFT_85596 [Helobdella robusta]